MLPRDPVMKPTLLPALCAAVLLLLGGCRAELPAGKPRSEYNVQEASGAAVFENNCAGCHYPDRTDGLHGPGLEGLLRRPSLPSGAPANEDRVRSVIRNGRGMMPPYGNRLDEQQLEDLLAYLRTL
jgi:mono/diheme cytochrome c family protein